MSEIKHILPVAGDCSLIREFIEGTLGNGARDFYACMKVVMSALREDRVFPRVMVFSGPAGSGKTFLQEIITKRLGGRSADASAYLLGHTQFNAPLFEAEHLVVQDPPAIGKKNRFESFIKEMCCCVEQRCYQKHRPDSMRRAGWFLSVSVGEESDFLEWVPVHDAALADKVAVLTTRRVDGFFPEDYAEAGLFIQKLAAQMPALVHFILKEGGGL